MALAKMTTSQKIWSTIAVWAGISTASVVLLTACGSNNSATNTTPPPAVVAPLPTGPIYGQGPIPPGTKLGFYAQNPNMNQYYPNNQSTYNVENDGMARMLKFAMGACDRNTYDGGLSACSSWTGGYHDMVIFMDGAQTNMAKVVFRSYPKINCNAYGCGAYYYSLPSLTDFFLATIGLNPTNQSGIFNPMVLDMTIWPINNNQGFELRANGPQGSRTKYVLIQIRVENGRVENGYLDFTATYNGYNFGSGRFIRCTKENCGLNGI